MPIESFKPVILLPQRRGSTVGAFQRVAETAGIPVEVRSQKPASIYPENDYSQRPRDTYIIWARDAQDEGAFELVQLAVEKGARVGVVALVNELSLESKARRLGIDHLSSDEMTFKETFEWLKSLRDVKSYLRSKQPHQTYRVSPFPWNNR